MNCDLLLQRNSVELYEREMVGYGHAQVIETPHSLYSVWGRLVADQAV